MANLIDSGGYLPLAIATRPSFRLAAQVGNSRKRIEATSPDIAQLLDLNRQLEGIGYQFMSLERLTGADAATTTAGAGPAVPLEAAQ